VTRTVDVSEAAFQDQVIQLAHVYGWRVAHFRPAQTSKGWRTAVAADGKGFPDLVLVRDRLIVAELKARTGRPTPEQHAWLEATARAGVETYMWRPADLDEIGRVLARRPRR
jgi:hypothetical protein